MTAEVYKYRVWCETDNKYVETWGDSEPTVCPENNGHSIDADKTVIVETVTKDFPTSEIDDYKISVHTSYKPKADKKSYAYWTGSGDDLATSPTGIGEGELLHFQMSQQSGSPVTTQVVTKKVEFDPTFGRTWIHQGYLNVNNGGHGDYLTAVVKTYATPLQTVSNKILYIEDDWVKYAIGSPSPATHGWAGTPIPIPRTFMQDGDWDYDGVSLTPNLNGDGEYKISSIERTVHRFINKIPCSGTIPFLGIASAETSELPTGYFIEISAFNISNTNWHANVMIEMYRERTFVP
jgi:hypothetical protein